ncbi:hypothetical protein WR25_22942 [Diploscapter pachys]|uniref:Secreted protein n=1 Tax=Diploscapter pachys TaxID=2018661 RepID=A0A2A2LC61_9BILA|nr:hypothetical protein WR25_22942 [Diploscapter pachys]
MRPLQFSFLFCILPLANRSFRPFLLAIPLLLRGCCQTASLHERHTKLDKCELGLSEMSERMGEGGGREAEEEIESEGDEESRHWQVEEGEGQGNTGRG